MKFSKSILVAALLGMIAPAAFGTGTVAKAAGDCTISSADVDQIAAIQNDPTLSYTDEIKAELALRKQLIEKIITCGEGDATTLSSALQGAALPTGAENVRSELMGKLADAQNFYGLEAAKLDGVGIAGTQAIAKEILSWRTSSYDPLAAQVSNFILWSKNQNLFTVASTRMEQTRRAVAFLESISNNADLSTALTDAQTAFNAAEDANTAAKNALLQSMPSDQSLALIKQSLDSLSDTYKKFGAISVLIKQFLPQ